MTDNDSHHPNSFHADRAECEPQPPSTPGSVSKPHPLDMEFDDSSAGKPSIYSLRNAIAAAATLCISLLLSLVVGSPQSFGAAVGVFFATAVLFGPLWFALANQRYDKRFQGWKNRDERSDETAEHSEPIVLAVPVHTPPIMETPADGASEANPPRELGISFYTPTQRLARPTETPLSYTASVVVIVFGFFVAAILIITPFVVSI